MRLLAALVASALAFAAADPSPVNVGFYLEVLCPDCKAFTTDILTPALTDGLADVMNLTIVPYGNAHGTGDATQCQHGPIECLGNIMDLCAQALFPGAPQPGKGWFGVHACLEDSLSMNMDTAAANKTLGQCAYQAFKGDPDADHPASAIRACAFGQQGKDLEKAAAAATGALDPPHQYVPWVTVGDGPIDCSADCSPFVPTVCSKAKKHGFTTLPKACDGAIATL